MYFKVHVWLKRVIIRCIQRSVIGHHEKEQCELPHHRRINIPQMSVQQRTVTTGDKTIHGLILPQENSDTTGHQTITGLVSDREAMPVI